MVWVFSRVLLLLCFDTILKAINTKSRLTWKPKNWEKNHDVLSFIIFLINNTIGIRENK